MPLSYSCGTLSPDRLAFVIEIPALLGNIVVIWKWTHHLSSSSKASQLINPAIVEVKNTTHLLRRRPHYQEMRIDPSNKSHNALEKISHNARFCNWNVYTCVHFCCKMVYCGTWHWCIMWFGNWINYQHLYIETTSLWSIAQKHWIKDISNLSLCYLRCIQELSL